jgi:hypothetical protein
MRRQLVEAAQRVAISVNRELLSRLAGSSGQEAAA